MYIKSLFLKNIRSYTQAEIAFSPGINLLVGANNAGKSTIIKALYKPQKGYSLGKPDIRKTHWHAEIAIRFEGVTGPSLQLFRTKDQRIDRQTLSSRGRLTVMYGMSTGAQVAEDSYLYDPDEVKRLSQPLIPGENEKGVPVNLAEFTSLPDKEDEQNFMYPFFAKRKHHASYQSTDEDACCRVHEDLSNLAAKIQNISNSSHPMNKEFDRLCEKILNFKIGLIPGEQHSRKIGLFVNSSITIPLESMGEGVINVIGLIVILLTEDNKLFLIEELENDLHPAALKELLQLIIDKSDRNQFIISTHSNIVVKYLGSLRESNLIHISWKPYEGEVPGPLQVPTSHLSTVPAAPEARMQLLESLGYDLFDFGMYSGFLILEESSAEQVIRDFLIPNFTPSLTGRLRTIASQGASDLGPKFTDLHRLFLFVHSDPVYKNRAWAVGDGDAVGKENIQKLRESFSSWADDHFVTFDQPAFEYYFPEGFQPEVERILAIKDRRARKQEKSTLLRIVLNWAVTHQQEARTAFEAQPPR